MVTNSNPPIQLLITLFLTRCSIFVQNYHQDGTVFYFFQNLGILAVLLLFPKFSCRASRGLLFFPFYHIFWRSSIFSKIFPRFARFFIFSKKFLRASRGVLFSPLEIPYFFTALRAVYYFFHLITFFARFSICSKKFPRFARLFIFSNILLPRFARLFINSSLSHLLAVFYFFQKFSALRAVVY